MEAFVAAPLRGWPTFRRGLPSISPRRPLIITLPVACMPESSPQENVPAKESQENKDKTPSSKIRELQPKARISLKKALSRTNIASVETSAFLIRTGLVRINGTVVQDEKARVNIKTDIISVGEETFGTVQDGGIATIPDHQLNPRTQRDFRALQEGEKLDRKFSRRIDGGFYANKRYLGGK